MASFLTRNVIRTAAKSCPSTVQVKHTKKKPENINDHYNSKHYNILRVYSAGSAKYRYLDVSQNETFQRNPRQEIRYRYLNIWNTHIFCHQGWKTKQMPNNRIHKTNKIKTISTWTINMLCQSTGNFFISTFSSDLLELWDISHSYQLTGRLTESK